MDALSITFEQVKEADAGVEALLTAHHALMRAQSPEESCHVMTGAALRAEGARVFALRDPTGAIRAVGAFKALNEAAVPEALVGAGPVVELKSMHVAADARGLGLGRDLLLGILDMARTSGARGACLETGSDETFAAARRLYQTQGFVECPPFGDYRVDPLSVFMCRAL